MICETMEKSRHHLFKKIRNWGIQIQGVSADNEDSSGFMGQERMQEVA